MNRTGLILAAPLIVAVAGCSDGDLLPLRGAREQPVRPVIAQMATPLQDHLLMAGTIASREIVQMGFPAGGVLVERSASAGQLVSTGDLLARTDATTLELALQAARAELRMAEAELTNSRQMLARRSELHSRGVISDAVLDQTRFQETSGATRVERAQANVRIAEDQLEDSVLLSGLDGVVMATAGEVGEVIAPGSSVISIARTDTRDAVVDVPELLVSTIAIGDRWTVILEVAPEITSGGSVREIAPQADPVTRSYRVKIGLDEAPNAFRFGTTVFARPQNASDQSLFALPTAALIQTREGAKLWVVDPTTDAVGLRNVTARPGPSESAIIHQGLNAGEIVVTAGVNSLVEGQVVRLPEAFAR